METGNGKLRQTVFIKATKTNRYQRAQSHHHLPQLRPVAKTLITISQIQADEEHRDREIESKRFFWK